MLKLKKLLPTRPKITERLSDLAQKSILIRYCSYLATLDIKYQINHCLVRGLDYYTHTAFEIKSDDLGAQATVCGGGRYDGLVKELGGPRNASGRFGQLGWKDWFCYYSSSIKVL